MKITRHIHQLIIPYNIKNNKNALNKAQINIFFLIGKKIILIDSGPKASINLIYDYLKTIGRSLEDISHILLTHSHPENIGNALAIKKLSNAKIGIHQAEKSFSDQRYSFFNDWLETFQKIEEPTPIDFSFSDNDILELDSQITLKVVHTPGHTAGSSCFLLQQDNALFTGDSIPVPNTPPIFESWHESIKSMEKIENIPYAHYLLSSRNENIKGDKVQTFISESFDWLYTIYTIVDKIKNKSLSDKEIINTALKQLGFSEDEDNQKYFRSINSLL